VVYKIQSLQRVRLAHLHCEVCLLIVGVWKMSQHRRVVLRRVRKIAKFDC